MNATELRIGNYVYDEFNRLCQIKTIGLESVRLLIVEGGTNFDSKEISQCTPCTLTEEWLLKFGANKIRLSYEFDIATFQGLEYKKLIIDLDQGIMIRQGDINKNRHEDDVVTIHNTDKQGKILVHLIQNLYFALTGKELEIK